MTHIFLERLHALRSRLQCSVFLLIMLLSVSNDSAQLSGIATYAGAQNQLSAQWCVHVAVTLVHRRT